MHNRQLIFTLVLVAACAGGGRPADTASSDTALPEPPAVTQPDTMPTKVPMVTLETDRRSYRAGDPVELRIVNETSSSYTYNPCTRTVERESGSAWSEVKEDRICTMIAHMLGPDTTRVERTELAEHLTPGTYRIAVRFSNDTPGAKPASVVAYSQPITVTP